MSEDSQHTNQQKQRARRKWPWVIPLVIIGIIGLARLSLMTGPVHRWVSGLIVDTANSQLRPHLSVGSLSGDLWREATLTDVRLTEEGQQVGSVDTVHLEYSVLSYFGEAFEIREARLVQPRLELRQQPDSTWNVQHWMVPAPADTTAGAFAFTVGELHLDRGRMRVQMLGQHSDSAYVLDDMRLAGSVGYYGASYDISVDDFGLRLKNTLLDSPLELSAAAEADETSVTLEQLAVATGHSMLRASGQASLADSTGHLQARAAPLGWQDLAAYARDLPVRKDIDLALRLRGDRQQVDVTLEGQAEGIEQLTVEGQARLDSMPALTSFRIAARRLDLEQFMGDTAMPSLQHLEVRGHGYLPLQQYRQGELEGTLSADNLRQASYQLTALQGTFSVDHSRATMHLEPTLGRERLVADASVTDLWADRPGVTVAVRGNRISPGRWLQNPELEGALTFSGRISGRGWVPDRDPWQYQLLVEGSSLMGQPLEQGSFRGQFSTDMITNRSQLQVGGGELSLQARVRQLQQTPTFSFELGADKVNLAAFKGLEAYPSLMNATIRGEGSGRSIGSLRMQATARIDSSMLNGDPIDRLVLDTRVADSVITIREGQLSSAIADADFRGSMNIFDWYNRSNNLHLDMQLKDVSSFAAVADVDFLNAKGAIEGELAPTGRDSIAFEGTVDLQEINYDNSYFAERIMGGMRIELAQEPNYLLDFEISEPSVASVKMKNIALRTDGKLVEEGPRGTYELKFTSARQGQIAQAGSYRVSGDTVTARIDDFDLTSSLRTLSLERPFHLRYANGTLQTDTMRISSPDGGAFMELAAPHVDSLRQRLYLKGKNLNMAVIQEAALDESYLEGVLFGEIAVDRTDTSLVATSDIIMSELKYKQTELDTLLLRGKVDNERLEGTMELHQGGELIAEGALDIPFEAQNPTQLDDAFFTRPVSGYLRMHALELDRFRRLLEEAGYEDTEGTLEFDGRLQGQAGDPKLSAALTLRNARLSGVPVDSLVASMNYRHDRSRLNMNATLVSLQQKAFDAHAEMPLNVDLRQLNVSLPGPQDSVAIDVQTNAFNLQALNDFLNRDIARDLEGRVDGRVRVRGPRSDLQASGEITLRRGALRLVNAGVRLDHIESTLQFQPDKIVLANLRMESGSGRLRASGEMAMEQLVPGAVDISMNARNFKAANTEEFNALVNMDMQVGGTISRPNVSGRMEILNGFVLLDNFGEQSVEQVELDTTLVPEKQISLYDSLGLDLDLQFNRRFFVRNKRYLEMEIELDGQLDLLKDAGRDMQIFGTLNTSDGYAEPLGKRFELEEGSLAFSGPPDNPQINVRTLYEPPQAEQEVQIWYIIEGTVEDPQFRYESNPQMDLAGIISYTLFGQPYFKLNPAEQSVASVSSSNVAADFAVEVLLDRLESVATRRLGIDVVRIENTRVGGDSGTSITTGWYINPKVFFAIQNVITGSTPTTGFYLEYYLRENLKLILSQGNENRQGIDLQWEHDY